MKQTIKDEINKLYSLFKAPPKLDVKSTQQHLDTFTYRTVSKEAITPLKRAVNEIKQSGKCAWCGASKDKVQNGLTDELSKKEYQISALCKPCQDKVFNKVKYERIINNDPLLKTAPLIKRQRIWGAE
jgi:hypothetical protein